MVVHQNITNLAGYFHFLNVRKIPYVIESFCHQVFGKRFRFSLTPCDCVGYTPKSLAGEFAALGCATVGQTFFYEETPYANPAKDIQAVSRAVEARNLGQEPGESSPPFWGNMMTLVFRKN